MVQQKKVEAVTETVETIRRSTSSIFVDYRGLTVAEATQLRARCREANVLYHVIKNRLAKRAFEQAGVIPPEAGLKGPTAIAFGVVDPTAPARVMTEFLKQTEHVRLKGGFVGAKWIDPAGIGQLSKIPPREVLLARLTGSLRGPLMRLAWCLCAPTAQLARVLAAAGQKKPAAG